MRTSSARRPRCGTRLRLMIHHKSGGRFRGGVRLRRVRVAEVGSRRAPGAARVRDEAWREYSALPRFRRQHERRYAWRLRPWRPALVAVGVALAAALVLRGVLPAMSEARSAAAQVVEPAER